MKTDIVFEALGAQDELGAALGVAREHCALSGNGLESMLAEVQARVFDLGASVATPLSSEATTAGKIAYVQVGDITCLALPGLAVCY
jgi:cob(I)alamin adenosyltransferase